jgi:Ni/Fe-hydrogenase subunit HybB-like protein
MTRWLRGVQAALGRAVMMTAFVAVAAGVAAFASGLGAGDRPRTYAALIASWLFFAGAAAGSLAFQALFRIVDARWTRPMASLGGAQIAFVPVALVVLLVIVTGAGFAPWLHADPGSSWMSVAGLAIRELVLTACLLGCGFLLRPRTRRAGEPTGALPALYCLAFAIVLSIWAFDFVLGADPTWESTLVGPYVFMGAFIAGTALVTLLALARGVLGERARRDAGALILALSIFWAYLFWSQYLTIWYGNLPEEVGFALRRAEAGWGVVVLAVIGLVFVLPFVTLLHPAGRRSARVLGALLVLQLVGFWLNCHLLIVPSLTPGDAPALGVRDVLIALGMLGAFTLSVAPRVKTASMNVASQGANPGGARAHVLTPERNTP